MMEASFFVELIPLRVLQRWAGINYDAAHPDCTYLYIF